MNSPLHIDCQHRSPEWREARCGLVTASRCADVLAMLKKGGEAEPRRKYRMELAIEILTGQPFQPPISRAMAAQIQWGIEQEQFARAAYEVKRNTLVETCGFFVHATVERFGASPDVLVGSEGLAQIKCPTTATHLAWMLEGVLPVEHAPQMLAELACTERQWNDFVSFDPRLPEHLQLFIRRMERRDYEPQIAQLEREVVHFNGELDGVLAALPQKPQGIVLAMDAPTPDELIF
jgi:hypothetical protein